MTAHAKLSASGSHRWMNCPGSVKMEEGLPDESSEYAIYGTEAHALAEICLEENKNPEEYMGRTLKEVPVDEEMVLGVQEYLDYVRALKGTTFYEKQVDFSRWAPGGFGTADFIALDKDTMTIVDLKFGKGVQVYAEDNTQEILYALGAYEAYQWLYDFNTIKIVIFQPRLNHTDEWEITTEELLSWGKTIKAKAADTLKDDAPIIPGEEQCNFCKAKSTCKVLASHNVKLAAKEFSEFGEPIHVTDPLRLNNEEIAALLGHLDLFSDWINSLKDHALQELLAGNSIPGFKLVTGKSNRIWISEAGALKALIKMGFKNTDLYIKTTKFITLTAVEKIIKKQKGDIKTFNSLVEKPAGKKTYARDDDYRPAVQSSIHEDFEKIA